MASTAHTASAALSVKESSCAAPSSSSSSSSSLCRELQKSHLHKQQRLISSFPSSSFHGRISIRPIVVSQGLNGSSRPASITASSVSEVVVDSSVNASPLSISKLDVENADDIPSETKALEETISSVMADVANLVKLVDSRDIVELELKHFDYELTIRKKEALAPPPVAPASQIVTQAPYQIYGTPPPPVSQPHPVTSSAPPPPAPAATPTPAASPPSKSDLPRILSPMAGTFYKCPAPGEPAFVKVGDRVQKGQVICIVEAMKLMNEIEADQSGTIVEIIAEDGKPVSVDTPLYAIKP